MINLLNNKLIFDTSLHSLHENADEYHHLGFKEKKAFNLNNSKK